MRIGATFLPVAISAMMFGTLYAGIVTALADIIKLSCRLVVSQLNYNSLSGEAKYRTA